MGIKHLSDRVFLPLLLLIVFLACTPAAGAPPVMAWTVKPEALATEDVQIKPDLSLTFPVQDSQLLVPIQPSRFVLSYRYWGNGWELWDLAAGAKVLASQMQFKIENPVLSPDGQYIAGVWRTGATITAGVWSLKTDQRVTNVEMTRQCMEIKTVGFVGNDRVAFFHRDIAGKCTIRVYEIASGQQMVEFPTEFKNTRQLSPNGAYLVGMVRTDLLFCDAVTGKPCGLIPLDENVLNAGRRDWSNYKNIAFSRDGKECALLYVELRAEPHRIRIVTHDMATGAKKTEFAWDEKEARDGTRFEYLPDGTGWLALDTLIVDRTVRTAVCSLPSEKGVLFSRMAAPDQLFAITKEQNHLVSKTIAIPKEAIADTVATLKAGMKTEEAVPPPPAKPDMAGAPTATPPTPQNPQPNPPAKPDMALAASVNLDEAPPTPWIVAPAPADLVAATLSSRFPLKSHATVTGPSRAPIEIRTAAIRFTARQANSVIVEQIMPDPLCPKPFYRAEAWIERYDLATGALQAEMHVPSNLMALQDASPTGNTLALRAGTDVDRVEIWRLDQRTYKLLVAIRPCEIDSANSKSRTEFYRSDFKWTQSVETAAMIDDDHCLTITGPGVMVLWELPAGKPIWQSGEGLGRRLALSPDRTLGVVKGKCGLVVFETLTGKALNSLLHDTGNFRVRSMSIAPDGRQLAATVVRADATLLQVFDLATGAATPVDVPLPRDAWVDQTPTFPSPGYILIGPYLVDLEKKVVVWNYFVSGSRQRNDVVTSVPPGDGGWFCVDGNAKTPPTMIHTAVPHATATKTLAMLNAADLYLWAPGMEVSLNVTVVGDEAYRQQAVADWTKQLTALGFKVVDGSPNTLTARTFLVNEAPVSYHGTGVEFTVTPCRIEYSIKLAVDGHEVWKREALNVNVAPPDMMKTLTMKEGETAQQAADRLYGPPKQCHQLELPPTYILKEGKTGITFVSSNGLEDRPAPAPVPGKPGPGTPGSVTPGAVTPATGTPNPTTPKPATPRPGAPGNRPNRR